MFSNLHAFFFVMDLQEESKSFTVHKALMKAKALASIAPARDRDDFKEQITASLHESMELRSFSMIIKEGESNIVVTHCNLKNYSQI